MTHVDVFSEIKLKTMLRNIIIAFLNVEWPNSPETLCQPGCTAPVFSHPHIEEKDCLVMIFLVSAIITLVIAWCPHQIQLPISFLNVERVKNII